ncbi:conserved hypothetical protein [Kamptonema sp. PCC 6506]|nr:conserved hypothetical protein [Kamptonema sp. PCC 6506]
MCTQLLGLTQIQPGSFPDVGYNPPPNWDSPKFVLSQAYPKKQPTGEEYPWKSIDFRTSPREYMMAILNYSYEGNLENDFVVQNNPTRKWFHAPWLHWEEDKEGKRAREFVHGLTLERSSRPFELSATQTQKYRNYAVGFYNEAGGFTLGQVWANPNQPNPDKANFPEGTVSYKLLFTTAPISEVPYLDGAPEWVADIDRSKDVDTIRATKVRLLQIDIAVRDKRSLSGGWIFGTFQYDSSIQADSPWKRVRPLTLMWGNDPNLTQSMYEAGQTPKESWVDSEAPVVKYRSNPPVGINAPKTLGWAGRGNGPVDNPLSSCLSCHSTAQWPKRSDMTPPEKLTQLAKLFWFRNLGVNEPFDSGTKSLDFSLQLAVGIQNLHKSQETQEHRFSREDENN